MGLSGIDAALGRTREAIARRLEEASSVVLTTHVTPDGDGLGSALALARHLRRRGRSAVVINCSTAPMDLRWIYERGEFHVYNSAKHDRLIHEADAIVATDIGGTDRMGKMVDPVRRSRGTRIVIDHHIYDNDCFELALIDHGASSSSEITYDLLRHMGADIDLPIAVPLYLGLVTDTGGFAYSATSAKAHAMAAALLESGVSPPDVWRKTHCQVPLAKMRFLGLMLARLQSEVDGRCVWGAADLGMLQRHEVPARDAFEVVNHLLRVKGCEVGLFFMEISASRTKVSLRSAGRVDVCAVAKEYGGGGHMFASGCTMDGIGLHQAIPKMVAHIREHLPAEATA